MRPRRHWLAPTPVNQRGHVPTLLSRWLGYKWNLPTVELLWWKSYIYHMTRGANMLFNAVKLALSTWLELTHFWNEPLQTDIRHSTLVSFFSTEGCSWFISTPCSRRSLSKHKKWKSQNTRVKKELHMWRLQEALIVTCIYQPKLNFIKFLSASYFDNRWRRSHWAHCICCTHARWRDLDKSWK